MKYIKLYEELYDDSEETLSRLRELFGKFNIVDFEYEDGYIDSHSSVDLSDWELTEIPITFRTIFGNFDCSNNELTTLKNGPHAAMTYDCSDNKLTSLEFGPDETMGGFFCTGNLLTSLKHCPAFIGGDLMFNNNPIHNFDGLSDNVDFDDDEAEVIFKNTPIGNICGVSRIGVEEFTEFRQRFEKAVDGKKVKLSRLKHLRLLFSDKADNLEELVIKNGYEIV